MDYSDVIDLCARPEYDEAEPEIRSSPRATYSPGNHSETYHNVTSPSDQSDSVPPTSVRDMNQDKKRIGGHTTPV